MAITSFEAVGAERLQLAADGPARLLCPMRREAVSLGVCESCPHHQGYVRVGNSGEAEQDLRIACGWGWQRAIRLVDRTDARVMCPKEAASNKGTWRAVSLKAACHGCEFFRGLIRTPRPGMRGVMDKLLGRGVPFVHCGFGARVRFERMA